ncbi:MAG: T9SS type A sorting domain-containing protein [Bacteroidota bacterium]
MGLSTHTLSWTNLASASGQYNLYYSTDGGSSWTSIASNIIGNAYSWTLPNVSATQCLIKVMDYVNTCKYDVSNSFFTITPAAPILLTPNGGESYYSGYTASITWNSTTFYSSVKLDYSLDSGQTWINIIAATSNNGSYSWAVPNVYSTKCLVKASNSSNTNYYDISNAVFTLKPAVTIITPNGTLDSVIWGGCTNTSITFDRSTAYTTYKIEYSTNNGSTWNTIISSWTASTNPATYNWSIPNIPGSNNLIKVTPTSATSYYDQSDNTFTISKPITITYPNFGGIIQSGSVYNIKWQSDGISNIYDLYYSTNGGTSYTNITTAYNTSSNIYPWTVPAVSSTNCKVYIQDNLNTCKTDTSDFAFTITATAPSITVTSPNGGEHLVSGTTQSINWTSSGTSNNYNIEYTTNGGTTWTTIVSSYNTTLGTYLWTVPSVNTSLCLVRVTDASNSAKTDLSDASFYITVPPVPHASNNGPICVGNALTLSSTPITNATYLWTGPNGFTSTALNLTVNNNASVNMSGKYYLAATVNGITGTDSTTVVVNSLPNAPVKGSITQPSCSLATGSVVLNSLPATGTWILNPGNISGTGTSKTITGLSTGTYLYTVTNASACISTASDTITINSIPIMPNTPSVQSITQPTCNVATGSAVLNGLPATGTWTINPGSISGTGATTTITNLATGTYNFTVTTLPSCISSGTSDVVINAQPQAQSAPIAQSITQPTCTDANGTVVLTGLPASGTWTLNPGSIAGTGTSKTITGLTAGTYTYTVTNALNCTSVSSSNIVINTQPQTPAKPNVQSITQPTCNVATGSIALNGLPATGTWTLNPGSISGVGTTKTLTGLTSGTYNYTVTNSAGCTSNASDDAVVNVQPQTQSAPVVQSITQSTCSDPNSIVILTGLPATGTWTLNPGNISGSGTSKSITGLTVGTYNYTVTNASGCTSLASANIVINEQPQTPSAPVIQTINQPSCSSATASIVLSGLPATGTWTLNPGNISGSGTTKTISSLTAGTYSYTVTNVSACTSVSSANAVITPQPLTPTVPTVGSITQPTCALATGSVVLSDLPASGNWTINPGNISGSGTSTTLTGLTVGTHNFTVTNAASCTSIATTNVVINAQPTIPTTPVVGTITQPSCVEATGSVLLTGLPVTGTWTINPGSISGTGTSKTITLLTTGTYAYSVTNTAGCTSSASNNIGINAAPATPATPVVQTVNQTTCSTSTGNIALSNLPSSGTWTLNPGNISGTGTTFTLSALTAGTYSYTVTNNSACTSAATPSVVINSQPLTPVAPTVGTITQPTCVLAIGSVILTGLPASGSWTLNPGSIIGSGTSITIPNLSAGTYTYTVSNASNCTSLASANVTINAQTQTPTKPSVQSITQPTCNVATGSVVLSSLPSTGTWTINPGNITGTGTSKTITALTTGTYNFNVTNAAGCTSAESDDVVINVQPPTQTAPIVQSITQPTCSDTNNNVILNGLPATGTWTLNPGNITGTGTNKTLTGLSAGTYNFTVTNALGCTSIATANVVINDKPQTPSAPIVQTVYQPTCSSATASIVLNGLPSTGNWVLNPDNISGSGTSTTISSLTAGTYSYTVTNASLCTSVASANAVINSQPLTPAVPTIGSITQPNCSLATGSLVLSDLPASGNWTINPGNISGSGTSTTLTGLASGTYNYTVTNASLCTSTATTNITIIAQPSVPTAPIVGTITQPTCIEATGSVVLTGFPSTGTWTINPGSISGTGTTKTISLLTTGTYAYSVTNAAGCTSSASNNIDISAAPIMPAIPVVQSVNQPTCSTVTGSIALSNLPSSGTWILNPGNIIGTGTTTTLSALTAGTYSYTVTNTSACTSASTASVVINSQPITPIAPVIGTITQPNCVSATGSVVLNGLPSTGNWVLNSGSVNGSGTSITIPNLTTGIFNYTVTNASNCTSSASANVVINLQPNTPTTPVVGTITQPTCNLATGSVALSGLPSTGNWVINPGNISGSGTNITLTGLTPNTYNFTVSNEANCISGATSNVTVNAQPTTPTAPIVSTITQPTCTTVTASVVLTGLPVTGTWTINPGNINGNGASTTLSNLTTGIYNYSVTNDMVCTSSLSTNVVINAQPTTPIADSAIKGPLNVCQGQTGVNYTIPQIPNATSYLWTLPTGVTGSSTTASIYLDFSTTSTTGFIMVKGINACGDGNNSIIEVTVNTIPATPIIIQTGDSLVSNAPLGNQWYSATTGIINGATNKIYKPLQAGNYFDIVTLNECSSDSSNVINYDNTGINNNEINNSIKMYPNPAKDILTIETNLNSEQRLEIINLIGQTIYTASINKKAIINTSAFANGVYILKLYTDKEIVTRKFVKER